jgi:hypothetical protein
VALHSLALAAVGGGIYLTTRIAWWYAAVVAGGVMLLVWSRQAKSGLFPVLRGYIAREYLQGDARLSETGRAGP